MPASPLSDDLADQAAKAFLKHGDHSKAARALGLPLNTFRNRLKRAAERGMLLGVAPAMPGFRIARVSDGPAGRTVEQKPEHGEAFAIPAGHRIKGVSALVDADGRVVQQWWKTREGDIAPVETALKAAFSEYEGLSKAPPAPKREDRDLLTVYPLADHHLGLFSWARETGTDYDLKIGEKTLKDVVGELVQRAPASHTSILLNLGDFFHSDNNENQTRRSGNALDVDTRYAKVLQVGVSVMIYCVEQALRKHREVILRCLPGNHDPIAALALTTALACFFHGNKRVRVDTSPSPHFMHHFGRVMIAATHGDMTKENQLAGMMAAAWPREWGASDFRYGYVGHLHRVAKFGGERDGVIVETFQSLAAKDAWHHASGYVSGRSMSAITHHRLFGEQSRVTVAIPPRKAASERAAA